MNKAILVMDMPNECTDCPAHFLDTPDNHTVMLWCGGKRREIELGTNNKIKKGYKPEWCPLKEVPKSREFFNNCDDYLNGIDDGWNNCIEEILGEE